MKQTVKNILACLLLLSFSGCGSNSTGNVKVSTEMEGFMKLFDGKYTGVTAAIQQYAADPKMDTKDMDTKDLRDPKVTAAKDDNGQTCYTLTANDGVKDCTYSVCWKEGKIVEIEDKTGQ